MIKITMIGRIGQDARVNAVTAERNCVNFSICDNLKTKNADGETVNVPQWFDCSYFCTKTTIADYLKKGLRVLVIGNYSIDEYYSNQTGKMMRKNTIVVDTLQLIDFEEQQAAE